MTVTVTQPSINVREKLAELDKPTGIAGEAMLRAETPQEQFNLIGAGRRNFLFNGDMQIAQRNSTSAVTVSDGSNEGYTTVDRWRVNFGASIGGSATAQQVDAPSGSPFRKALKLTCASTASPTSSQTFEIIGQQEGRNYAALEYGTSNAKQFTLSFWIYANIAGTFGVTIRRNNSSGNRVIGQLYDYETANTWQKVVLTFVGDTTHTIEDGASANYDFVPTFVFSCGTGRQSSNMTRWQTYTAAYLPDDKPVTNFLGSTSNELYITGVQLELGKVATPFEHRSYGEELALCQRYCNVIAPNVAYGHYGFVGWCESTTRAKVQYTFPVVMRATPSLTRSGTFYYDGASTNPSFSSQYGVASTPFNCRIEDNISNGTTGQGIFLINSNDANATITFDAEL